MKQINLVPVQCCNKGNECLGQGKEKECSPFIEEQRGPGAAGKCCRQVLPSGSQRDDGKVMGGGGATMLPP